MNYYYLSSINELIIIIFHQRIRIIYHQSIININDILLFIMNIRSISNQVSYNSDYKNRYITCFKFRKCIKNLKNLI